jgi:hypothetical protein
MVNLARTTRYGLRSAKVMSVAVPGAFSFSWGFPPLADGVDDIGDRPIVLSFQSSDARLGDVCS